MKSRMTKNILIDRILAFNQRAICNGDYELTLVKNSDLKSPYGLAMLTEEGLKQKYNGSCLECVNYLNDLAQ